MKKLGKACHWALGVLLVLGFLACLAAALHDRKGERRGMILLEPRP